MAFDLIRNAALWFHNEERREHPEIPEWWEIPWYIKQHIYTAVHRGLISEGLWPST
jgi:hypothetical protein